MNKLNSTEIPLNDKTKFRLEEIQERKTMSKKLSKYIAAFDYIDKTLIALSATSEGISIISTTTVIGAPAGIASASFIIVFSLTTGIIKKLLKITRKKKKKHDKIVMLAKSKLNSIGTLMSQALTELGISMKNLKRLLMRKKSTTD